VLVKTDGVIRGLSGEIIARFEKAGLRIVGLKLVRATPDLILKHYPSDEGWLGNVGKATRDNLAKAGLSAKDLLGTEEPVEIGKIVKQWNSEYLTAAPVVAIVLEGISAVANVRRLTGKTMPNLAEPGTIRGDYSIDDGLTATLARRSVRNLIHASGNVPEAEYEIKLWFSDSELHPYRRADADIIGQ
jgi:nucleoside-diphosphate kinase